MNKTLPATDRTRLNDYLEDVREIERRLSLVAKSSEQSADVQVPFGIPESFSEHINLLWDLQVLAFRADITRVSTLMYAHDVSMRVYPESGVTSGNHPTSHHGGRPATVEAWQHWFFRSDSPCNEGDEGANSSSPFSILELRCPQTVVRF